MRAGPPLRRRPGREAALLATERLVAVHQVVSHLEYLVDDRDRRPGGLNSAPPTGAADRWSPRGPVSALVARPGVARALHVAGVLAAGSLLAPGGAAARWAPSAVLVAIGAATAPVNRLGSDGADRVGLLAGAVAAVARAGHRRPGVVDACLWFLAVTGVHGYAVAGWAKLLSPAWRDETAILGVLRTATHGHRGAYAAARRHRATTRLVSHGVVLLEAGAPLVLVGAGRRLAWPYVGAAACFHLGAAYVMGLNRFPAAFAALYPGLLYSTDRRRSASPERGPARPDGRDDLLLPVLVAVGSAWWGCMVLAGRRDRSIVARGRPGDTSTTPVTGRSLRTRRTASDRHDLPLVVLVHGAGETLEHWGVVPDRLAERSRVLSYDRPAPGSDPPGAGRGPVDPVTELVDLVDSHAQGGEVVLVGRSTGAHLAWCASVGTAASLHAVVLVDAVHPDHLRHTGEHTAAARARQGARTTAAWVRWGWGPLLGRPPWSDAVPPHVRRLVLAQQRRPALWSAALEELDALGRAPAPMVSPAARHLVIVSADPPLPGTPAAAVLADHPSARHVSLVGHGQHSLWRDDDADALVAVIRGLLPPGGAPR